MSITTTTPATAPKTLPPEMNNLLTTWWLALGFAFLAFLFLFTDAAQWAESYTAINRLVMHLVPAVVTLLALLLRDVALHREPIRTTPASASRSSPA